MIRPSAVALIAALALSGCMMAAEVPAEAPAAPVVCLLYTSRRG